MTRKIGRLLNSLREAIHEAIGESHSVASVLAELEREGHSPTFMIDVGLPQGALTDKEISDIESSCDKELPSLELVTRDGPLYLTAADEDFLRNLGVATPARSNQSVASAKKPRQPIH